MSSVQTRAPGPGMELQFWCLDVWIWLRGLCSVRVRCSTIESLLENTVRLSELGHARRGSEALDTVRVSGLGFRCSGSDFVLTSMHGLGLRFGCLTPLDPDPWVKRCTTCSRASERLQRAQG